MANVGEKIVYHEYLEALDSYQTYMGEVFGNPGGNSEIRHGVRHLRIDDEDLPQGFRNLTNVENIENWEKGLHWGQNFWTHARESAT